MSAHILQATDLCGSIRVYLVADASGWYVVDGLELTAMAALEMIDNPILPPNADVAFYTNEALAMLAYEAKTGPEG